MGGPEAVHVWNAVIVRDHQVELEEHYDQQECRRRFPDVRQRHCRLKDGRGAIAKCVEGCSYCARYSLAA